MGKFLSSLILAGAVPAGLALGFVGCRADAGSRSSSQMDEASAATREIDSPRAASNGSTAATAPSASDARSAPAREDRPLIVCFGDSLTAGYGADEGFSYPDYLQKDLDRDGYRYRVLNEGVSGNTTKDGVDRLPGIVAMRPAVVVLEFGGNDGLRGFKTQTTKANLATMIEGLKGSGARVVLAGITLPPDYGADYVSTFTANYPTLAHKYKVPVLPFLLKDVYGVDGMMQADRTHATDKGNEVVARNVLPLVEPLLRK